MSQHPDQPAAPTPVSSRAIGKLIALLKAILSWIGFHHAKTTEPVAPLNNAPFPVMLTGMAALEPAHLALLVTGLAQRCTRLMTGIAPDALISEVASRITLGVGVFGQRPTTVVRIGGAPTAAIDHVTGVIVWITEKKDEGIWLCESAPGQWDLVSALGQDIASGLTGVEVVSVAQDGSMSRTVIRGELAAAIARRLAPHIAMALFSQADATLAVEVSRLTGPNAALFGWLMADGNALRKELRLEALHSFPLMGSMITMLDPPRFRSLEAAIDAGAPVIPAVAEALNTSEAAVLAARRIFPGMLGPLRLQRLFGKDFRSAASIPVAQLPGGDGMRPDIGWRKFIDFCRMADAA